jgi:hypothetical protein
MIGTYARGTVYNNEKKKKKMFALGTAHSVSKMCI